MKIYGVYNVFNCGDTHSNCINARKSSVQRNDGKSVLRNTNQKSRLKRTIKRRRRLLLKKDTKEHLNMYIFNTHTLMKF